MTRLTLAQALSEDRLQDFASQAEADGIGPADRAQFDTLMGRVTAPQPAGQTSRSPVRGSKRGK
jgi:hypothetical protein